MAEIVVLGAGLGGTIMAYEMLPLIGKADRLTVIGEGSTYHFVPSNPWVAVGWRKPADIEVKLDATMARKRINFISHGASRVHPEARRIDINDGSSIAYDYLIIATGPELAFDEIEGLGPAAFTQSVCHVDHASQAYQAFEAFCADPGPVVIGAAQGASCFGPAYEFAMILDSELRKRGLRDRVPMTYITPEPYIGHLGLDGVGDTKSLLESELRNRHVKWVTNARIVRATAATIELEEVAEDGTVARNHSLPHKFAMILPPFRGVKAVFGIDKLTNPRGFILADKHQQNPTYKEIFSIGVAVAIPPIGPTPVPVGVPKTGFMIESMVTAVSRNVQAMLAGQPATWQPTWNAVCLADFGERGIAFVAQPQLPPRNLNWSSKGRWVHMAKIGFEKYFLHKIRKGESEPFYERFLLEQLNLRKLKQAS
jgi:sulfide:quinone oxidoreductase